MSNVYFGSEKDLEDYICESFEKNGVCPITGESVDLWWRQVNLGGYGIADIVKVIIDATGIVYVTVLELKNEKITAKCLAQTLRYKTGIQDFIKEFFPKNETSIEVYSELLGTSLSMQDDTCYLINNLENISVYSFEINVDDGFSVKEIGDGWSRTNPDFSPNKEITRKIKRLSINRLNQFRKFINEKKEMPNES